MSSLWNNEKKTCKICLKHVLFNANFFPFAQNHLKQTWVCIGLKYLKSYIDWYRSFLSTDNGKGSKSNRSLKNKIIMLLRINGFFTIHIHRCETLYENTKHWCTCQLFDSSCYNPLKSITPIKTSYFSTLSSFLYFFDITPKERIKHSIHFHLAFQIPLTS